MRREPLYDDGKPYAPQSLMRMHARGALACDHPRVVSHALILSCSVLLKER